MSRLNICEHCGIYDPERKVCNGNLYINPEYYLKNQEYVDNYIFDGETMILNKGKLTIAGATINGVFYAGNTIIVNQANGIDVWYSNIDN